MTALQPIMPRLSKLVPRLASDADGEIVATVRQIGRALRDAGLDWHDFTASLAAPPVVRPRYEPPKPTTPRDVAQWCRQNGPGRLTQREADFVQDICARLVFNNRLTEKQERWLAAIYAKLGGAQ